MHWILTRFNSEPVDPIQRRKLKFLDNKWIDKRLELVAKYFRPSLENQTCKDFRVVIAVHPDSPPEIIAYFSEFAEVVKGQITDWRIYQGDTTTRVDSDDMLHKNFVARVKSAPGKLPLLVDFHTAQYNALTKSFHQVMRGANNSQFVSVKGSTQQRNCYSSAHTNMPRLFKNQVRIPIFGGVQVIHENNIFTISPKGPKLQLNPKDYGL